MSGILSGLFEKRASTGTTFHVSQTPPAYVETFAGYETPSGVSVHPDTALEISAVYACVRVLAETVASLPLILYRRRDDGGKDRATEHPLYRLLHDIPNPHMTSFQLREALMGHILTWGNAYAEIEFDRAGRVVGLWPLRPDRMAVRLENGELIYEYRTSDGPVTLPDYRVLHIPGLGFDGIVGYSPIRMMRQALGLTVATERFGSLLFKNAAQPKVVLKHPGELSEKAYKRLRESWESRHGGLENAHRTAILEEGVDITTIGIPPDDAQFLETRRFQLNEIARIYRVPPHMIQDLERATFSNIEQESINFVVHTVRPWLVRWEQAMNKQLLLERERESLFVEFLVDGLLRGDIMSRYQAYAIGRQNGWLSADDIRRLENMNPLPDGLGETYLVPLNMIPASSVSAPAPAPGMETERATLSHEQRASVHDAERRAELRALERRRLQQAYFEIYRDVAARILRREANDVRRQVEKSQRRRDLSQFWVWLDDFYREHEVWVREQMTPLARSYGALVASAAFGEVGHEVDADDALTPEVDDYIRAYLTVFAARHCNVSRSRIAKAGERQDPEEAILEELAGWPEKRAEETARWESVRFNNALAVAVYGIVGVRQLRWVAFGESCPYCSALNGQVVGIEEPFLTPGEFQPDGADRALTVTTHVHHAPAHSGCDCMVVAT